VHGGTLRLRVRVDGVAAEEIRAVLEQIRGVIRVEDDRCTVESAEVAPLIADAVAGRGWRLCELAPIPDDLEVAFLASVTGEAL
jgi:hypothetical protein